MAHFANFKTSSLFEYELNKNLNFITLQNTQRSPSTENGLEFGFDSDYQMLISSHCQGTTVEIFRPLGCQNTVKI